MSQRPGTASDVSHDEQPPSPAPRGLLVLGALGVLAAVTVIVVLAAVALTNDSPSSSAPAVELTNSPEKLSQVLDATEVSLHDYWSAELPELYGKPFTDLKGGFQPK